MAYDDLAADYATEEEGEGGRSNSDGSDGVEASGGGIEAAREGVNIEDVGEDGRSIGVGELAPGSGGDAVPGVAVDMLMLVSSHHL